MDRQTFTKLIQAGFKTHPIVALLGPRQCGKTTLARMIYKQAAKEINNENYFDLESVSDLLRLQNPQLALENLTGLIVIDEIQRRPELFPLLRVLVDRPRNKQKFLILGSASRELIQQSSETLAGRIRFLELTPFTLAETGDMARAWIRGGFPRSYLAKNEAESFTWREDYIRTFLEQDIPNLGIKIPPLQLRRFWMMLAHYHGQVFNASEIGRALSINHKTVRNYLDILVGTFMLRELPPWFENIAKRQVKASKIYVRDSGILHALLRLRDKTHLIHHPKLAASWEGFALEEVIRYHRLQANECFFWGTHAHAELDLLLLLNGKRVGFEFKYSDSPTFTKSMQIAIDDLKLDQIIVIYPGVHRIRIKENVEIIGLNNYIL